MRNFPFKEEAYEITGICMEVHRILGYGFSEIVYKDAIELEATGKGFLPEREKEFNVNYKGKILQHKFFADFILFDTVILEIKACTGGIMDEHISQTLNYLKISGCSIGLVVNFSKRTLSKNALFSNLCKSE